jgi:hypothetical protein
VLLFIFSLGINCLFAQTVVPEKIMGEPSTGYLLGEIAALRDLEPQDFTQQAPPSKVWLRQNYFFQNPLVNPDPLPKNGDPLAHPLTESETPNPELTPYLNFEGLRDPSILPPDPTGDIGKDHYVQMINASGGSWFQVWDKSGQSVLDPIKSTTFWAQVGSGSIGDPIIQYDPGAERWVIIEMQGFLANECLLAISNTSDPTGSWKAYRFGTQGFPDYPKLYIWNDSYIITANEISGGNKCAGYALDRDDILAGQPTFDLSRFEMPNFSGIQYQPASGADWEGSAPPPPGSPAYIFRVYDDSWGGGQDQLNIWEVHVDWDTPGSNYIEGPKQLFPTPFETRVCFGSTSSLFDCLEQPNSSTRITALENIIMYKASYRNFGTHESVVLNHVSDVSGQIGDGGDAAIRWYELRKENGQDWYIYQEGTYAPDLETNRFMCSIALDELGNIAMGYSVVSESVFPGLRITGRRSGDPLNEMTIQEYTLIDGAKSHTSSRWGDYSVMSVDPEDGRTFWYTGEYQPSSGQFGTRIGSFAIFRDTFDITPQFMLEPVPSALLGDNEQVTVEVFNSGLLPAYDYSLNLWYEGMDLGSEFITDTVQPGESYMHTFSQTIPLNVPGKQYLIEVISNWGPDSFEKNDTLRVRLDRPTEADAAFGGRDGLPGQVCSSEFTFGYILKNAAGLPMTSANILYRVNSQPWDTIPWTGLLAPGERDTVPITMTGITDGLNGIRVITDLPNGEQDQNISNDSMLVKFYGNLQGTYINMQNSTEAGLLHWEVRDLVGGTVASGETDGTDQIVDICSTNNACYTVRLRSVTLTWEGQFALYDIYGNELVSATYATQEEQVFEYCTPDRKTKDVGALTLLSPQTGPSLQADESVSMLFRNFGLDPVSNINVAWRVDGGAWNSDTYANLLEPGETVQFDFAGTADLSNEGQAYQIDIRASVFGDEEVANNAKSFLVRHMAPLDAAATDLSAFRACADTTEVLLQLDLENNGFDTITSLVFGLVNNGVLATYTVDTITILPAESAVVYFHPVNIQFGANTCTLELTEVNGIAGDGDLTNNSRNINYFLDAERIEYQLGLLLDGSPVETTWELQDDNGNILESGGPYTNAFESITVNWCLEKDSCFQFVLYDAGGDGMTGLVFIDRDSVRLWDNGGIPFMDQLAFSFCTEDVCAGFGAEAEVEPASGIGASDGSITINPIGGTAPFEFSIDQQDFQSESVFDGLPAGTYQLVCRDALGCEVELEVTLGLVSTKNLIKGATLEVSPNPTSNMVRIQLEAVSSDSYVLAELFDLEGRLLQAGRMYRWGNQWKGTLALDTYASGAYLLRVRSTEAIWEKQIIRQ